LTADFDYELPPELIAQEPIEPRDASRLLVLDRATGTLAHRRFGDVADYLRPGDLLVANESRVIPARLPARKVPTGGRVELLLVARHDDTHWEALVKGRKVPVGQRLALGAEPSGAPKPRWRPSPPPADGCCASRRPSTPIWIGWVWCHCRRTSTPPWPTPNATKRCMPRARLGAAPTAGLHFTPQLMARLREMGVEWPRCFCTSAWIPFAGVRGVVVEEHQIHTNIAR
jgi:S-adenosylmethionine:tRNA ribosyltransferase-isomerase